MVYEVLTAALRASLTRFLRLAMHRLPILPAALCAAIGLPMAAPAWADSPVVVEGPDHDTRRAILDLLPDREAPESLFDAERIAEEAAQRALVWLRSEGYYGATVTPEASENPPAVMCRFELQASADRIGRIRRHGWRHKLARRPAQREQDGRARAGGPPPA